MFTRNVFSLITSFDVRKVSVSIMFPQMAFTDLKIRYVASVPI